MNTIDPAKILEPHRYAPARDHGPCVCGVPEVCHPHLEQLYAYADLSNAIARAMVTPSAPATPETPTGPTG